MEGQTHADITFSRNADSSWTSSLEQEGSPCKRPKRTYAEVVAASASTMESRRGQPDRQTPGATSTGPDRQTPGATSTPKTKPSRPWIRKYIMGLKNKKGSTTYYFTRPRNVMNKKKVTSKKLTAKVPVPALTSPLDSTASKGDTFMIPKTTPSEKQHDKDEMIQKVMFDWILEPGEIAKNKKSCSSTFDLDSLDTLAQRIKPIVDIEPINLNNTSIVEDWISKYIDTDASAENDRLYEVAEDAKSSQTKSKSKQRKTREKGLYLEACPICYQTVPRMREHLQRKCMSNKLGFCEAEITITMSEIKERRNAQKVAVVCQSELIQNYNRLNGKDYLNYLFAKFEQCGVLVNKDSLNFKLDQLAPPSQLEAFTPTLPVPNVPTVASPLTSEYSWQGEVGVNQSWDDVIVVDSTPDDDDTPIKKLSPINKAFTPTLPVPNVPNVASPLSSKYSSEGEVGVNQSWVESTPIKKLSPRNKITIALSPIMDVETPRRPAPSSALKSSESKITPKTLIKTPVVVLERLPVKRKLEVSLEERKPTIALLNPINKRTLALSPIMDVETPRRPAPSSALKSSERKITPKTLIKTPVVVLEQLPVKRKLEVSLEERKPTIALPVIKKTKSESSGSTIIATDIKYTKEINVKMASLGFYRKFSSHECPILNEFNSHLEFTMNVTQKEYRNQIVANVNRVLYRLHPKFENPDALADTAAIKNYFKSMPTELSSPSKANYIKALGMFLSFCAQTCTVSERYAKLIQALTAIRECLASIRTGLAKATSRRMAEKRASQFRGERKCTQLKDVMNCVEVMKDKYLHYLDSNVQLSQDTLKSINTYFNAVITLKNAHRPSVYTNMLLKEFNKPVQVKLDNGDVRYNVGVVEHKTASTQLATVSFTDSEYKEIQKYIANVRVKFAHKCSPKTVFLNKNGLKVHNPSSDLHDRQSDLGLPYINSTDARHSYETMSAKLFGHRQRTSVAHYLAHSVATASANYVDMTEDTIKEMAISMAILQDPKSWQGLPKIIEVVGSCSAPATAAASGTDPATVSSTSNDANKVREYKSIIDHFPVSCDTNLPSKWDLKLIAMKTPGYSSFDDADFKRIRGRLEYRRLVKRVTEAVSAFPFMRPSTTELLSYLKQKGWYTKDSITMFAKNWVPSSSTQATPERSERLDACLRPKIAQQNWRSCVINNGILVAKRVIMKGEVICDYHADVLSGEEGQKKYDGCLDHTYRQKMFFFKCRDMGYCIDGNLPCSCHQLEAANIKGRCIENAIELANAIPKIHWLDDRPHLILEARHTIQPGEAIKFDAGAPIQ